METTSLATSNEIVSIVISCKVPAVRPTRVIFDELVLIASPPLTLMLKKS